MFGIKYLKSSPTTHVIHYNSGQQVRQGAGLAFWYFSPSSVIVRMSLASIDTPFVFSEITSDVQDATIQGELTYRIVDPEKTASLLDFSVDGRGRYQSDDPEKLGERLVKEAQIRARAFTQHCQLSDLLIKSDELVDAMLPELQQSESIANLGIEILGLSILSIAATPDMTKALQAKAREQLLLEADEAMHHRRNTAVELERQIKENELQTEIAMETKRRQIREKQVEADIAIEQQRASLVELQVENDRKQAQGRGESLRATLEPIKEVDWRTLVAMSGNNDSRSLIAMAFHELADGAEKIGTLNITPDLLNSLLSPNAPADPTEPQSDL